MRKFPRPETAHHRQLVPKPPTHTHWLFASDIYQRFPVSSLIEAVDHLHEGFQQISHYNRWDARTTLNNVIGSLSRVASTCFISYEADFEEWTIFRTRFRDLFGRLASRVVEQQQKLSFPSTLSRQTSPTSHLTRTCSDCVGV